MFPSKKHLGGIPHFQTQPCWVSLSCSPFPWYHSNQEDWSPRFFMTKTLPGFDPAVFRDRRDLFLLLFELPLIQYHFSWLNDCIKILELVNNGSLTNNINVIHSSEIAIPSQKRRARDAVFARWELCGLRPLRCGVPLSGFQAGAAVWYLGGTALVRKDSMGIEWWIYRACFTSNKHMIHFFWIYMLFGFYGDWTDFMWFYDGVMGYKRIDHGCVWK